MTPESEASLESQYDAQIDACSEPAELLRLRGARNADCSHTRNLPKEVLLNIFEILATEDDYIDSWVDITYVCHMWREIALNEPSLWTNFSESNFCCSSSEWIDELFVRSKEAPLSLCLDDEPSEAAQRIFGQLIQSPERFKALTIIGNKEFILPLTKPMPYLEELSFMQLQPALMPDRFVFGSAPRLHSLKLINIIIPLDPLASSFSNVRTLCLHGEWALPYARHPLTVKSFLAFLSRLSQLVELTVRIPESMDATVCPSPGNTVQLPLKLLKVDTCPNPRAFKQILKSLVVPDTLVSMWIDVVESTIRDSISFFVTSTGAHPDTVQLLYTSIIFTTSPRGPFKERELCIQSHLPFSLNPYLSNVNIRTLYVSDHGCFPVFPILECRTIEEVRIRGDPLFEKFMQLEPHPVPYPSLRRLCLEWFDLTLQSKNFPRLKQWVDERQKTSALEKLRIENCRLSHSSEEIRILSETIPVDVVEHTLTM